MKYTPSFFRKGLPAWKRKKDPPLSRLVYRPLSFCFAALFANLGWTANAVTVLSIVVSFIMFALFITKNAVMGALLLNLWLVLDCTDGNIARCIGSETYGDFLDGIAGYICSALAFLGMGYCVYWSGGLVLSALSPIIMLLGSSSAVFEVLARLTHQRFLNTKYEMGMEAKKVYDPEKLKGINRVRMIVDQSLSIGGILPAAVLVASLVGALDLLLFIWGTYYTFAFLAVLFYYLRKAFQTHKA